MNILTIDNFTKAYTDRVLFDEASFSMQDYEKIGVIGINGMGKSTLLKIVAGIEEPEIGHMVTMSNLKVAYLPQNPVDETVITDKAKVLLNKLKRFTFDAPIEKLSGGQRKCIALANILTQDADLLILDDFGLAKMTAAETRDFLELIEDRNTIKSCMIISQLPVSNWYDIFFDPTLADAIMDRVLSNSYKIELKGRSRRGIFENNIEL